MKEVLLTPKVAEVAGAQECAAWLKDRWADG
jgi:hypothetical protein